MKTILIADDDLLIRKAYTDIFEDQGYEVKVYDNGKSAVEGCAESMPDIIILDIHMPELNGLDACKNIRALPGGGEVPVLVISGSIGQSEVESINCGASRFVHKPINTKGLISVVRELIDSK